MKDSNIEQQLADKLGNRSLKPSADAWARVAHNRQQAKQTNNNNKKKAFFFYAAAVAVFFIVGGYAFFSMNQKAVVPANTPQVVGAEKQVQPDVIVSPLLPGQNTTEAPVIITPVRKPMPVAQVTSAKDKTEALTVPVAPVKIDETYGNIPSAVVMHQPATVSKDAEVELLLNNATKDVAMKKLQAKPTSDTALLKEAEGEMDDYHREKAMKIFALKHKTIRFAVNKE